ncbi:CobQ/CobB/MinD/ParA nucleotide binding domain-containing protein [Alteromonadaceae bacterium 2753L.S.0a.02]|nr:CobQ/CobB/MinD/ParA nucleotide binding domain-containing protein [Alteromonadaceae bacterium 2753L.S.0a.02]
MAKLHFIGGEKGGVGKSFTSRLLAQYHIDNKLDFAGFDTDESHPTFSRFYGDFTKAINVNDLASLDEIVAQAEDQPNHDIIVDLAAQTWSHLWRWMEDCELVELMAELGFSTHLWQVMDDSADCANLLEQQLKRLKDTNINLVLVLNEGRGNNFELLKASAPYQQAIDAGAGIITLAPLNANVAQQIDFSNSSFWAAINNKENLRNVDRIRARVWVFKHYDMLKTLLEPTVHEMLDELESNIISGKFQTNN